MCSCGWKVRMISSQIPLNFGSYRPIKAMPTAVIILYPQWNTQFCQTWMYLRFWSHSPHLISPICPIVGPTSVLLDVLIPVVIFTNGC